MTNTDPCEVIPRFNEEYQDSHKSVIFVKPFELQLPDGTTIIDGTRETIFMSMRFSSDTSSDEGHVQRNGVISESLSEFEGITLWDKDYTESHDERIIVFDDKRYKIV